MLFYVAGMGGAGKDTIVNALLGREDTDPVLGWLFNVSRMKKLIKKLPYYTTRSPRKGEVDGYDYHFVSEDEFVSMGYDNKFLEARVYHLIDKNVRYATPMYDFHENYIICGSVDQYVNMEKRLLKYDKCYCIYIDADARTRAKRMLKRAKNNDMVVEACRRLYKDEEEYLQVKDKFHPNIVVNNNEGQNITFVENHIADIICRELNKI